MRPDLSNHGIGIRAAHYAELLERGAPSPWLEAITENFAGRGGRPLAVLERLRADSKLILHGVSLDVGGTDALDERWLAATRALAERLEVSWVSDHLCFGGAGGHHGHDLWPLPHTEAVIAHVVARVERAQELLGRRLVLENVSSYLSWKHNEMPEWDFVAEVARRSGCGLLLDVNNVYVNATNHGFSPRRYLEGIPPEAVLQYHLAGHEDRGRYLLDTHEDELRPEVLALYAEALELFGPRPTILEWDGDVPSLDRVLAECERAREAERHFVRKKAAA